MTINLPELLPDVFDKLDQRLAGVGVLYVDRDLATRADEVSLSARMRRSNRILGGRKSTAKWDGYQHSDTARAVVRVTVIDCESRNAAAWFKPPRDTADHPQLWRWVVDHHRGSWHETTRSPAAKDLCRSRYGIHSARRGTGTGSSLENTRLWFFNLPDVVFAAAWPWARDWAAADLHRSFMAEPLEVVADFIGERMPELGEGLLLWNRAQSLHSDNPNRLSAAVHVFDAAKPIRDAARKLGNVTKQLYPESKTRDAEIKAARAALLDFGRGAPLRAR